MAKKKSNDGNEEPEISPQDSYLQNSNSDSVGDEKEEQKTTYKLTRKH